MMMNQSFSAYLFLSTLVLSTMPLVQLLGGNQMWSCCWSWTTHRDMILRMTFHCWKLIGLAQRLVWPHDDSTCRRLQTITVNDPQAMTSFLIQLACNLDKILMERIQINLSITSLRKTIYTTKFRCCRIL